jgi:hypothetical protein
MCDGWSDRISQWSGSGGVCSRLIRARNSCVMVAQMVAEAGREAGLSADQVVV